MLGARAVKPQSGFTIVELMVTVAIVAILLAVGAPAMGTFIRNTEIRTASESMLAGLNLARTEALRRNTRVSLWLVTNTAADCARSSTGKSWVVSIDDPAGRCNAVSSVTNAPRLVQSRNGSDGSPGVNVAATSSCITFNGFGRVESTCPDGASPITSISFVSATSPASTRDLQVRITSGGAARLCDPDATSGTSVC